MSLIIPLHLATCATDVVRKATGSKPVLLTMILLGKENTSEGATTGIAKSFLKTIAKPADEDSGTHMINGEGEFVVAVADESSWKNFQDKAKASKDQTGKPDDPELEDPISHRLFSKPVKTPCCNTTYSEEGIQQSLLDNDFICPKCGADEILLDSLKPDTEMEERVKKYREEKGLDSPKAEKRNSVLITENVSAILRMSLRLLVMKLRNSKKVTIKVSRPNPLTAKSLLRTV